jgi:hypothetical protein
MHHAFAASVVLGAITAAPQTINIEVALAIPNPTIEATKPAAISYKPTSAASAVTESI